MLCGDITPYNPCSSTHAVSWRFFSHIFLHPVSSSFSFPRVDCWEMMMLTHSFNGCLTKTLAEPSIFFREVQARGTGQSLKTHTKPMKPSVNCWQFKQLFLPSYSVRSRGGCFNRPPPQILKTPNYETQNCNTCKPPKPRSANKKPPQPIDLTPQSSCALCTVSSHNNMKQTGGQ